MSDRVEIGGIENGHREKKRKKYKSKKGKRDGIFGGNGSEISAKSNAPCFSCLFGYALIFWC